MKKFNYRKIIPIFLGFVFTMVATVVLMIFIHETQTSSVRRSGEISCFTDGVFKCGNLRASNEEIIKEMNYLGLSPEETKVLMLEAQKDVKIRITELESKTNLTKKEKDLKDRLELSEIYYENALEALGVNVEGKDEKIQIDTSNWKTYKNEDYGFELKYSKEYSLGLSGSRNITFVHEKCLPLVQSENKNINKVSECAIKENFIIKILYNDLDTFIDNLKKCKNGKCSAEIILQEEYKEDVLNGKRIIVRDKNNSSLEYIVIQENEKLYVFVFSELNSNKLLEIISTLKFSK